MARARPVHLVGATPGELHKLPGQPYIIRNIPRIPAMNQKKPYPLHSHQWDALKRLAAQHSVRIVLPAVSTPQPSAADLIFAAQPSPNMGKALVIHRAKARPTKEQP